MRSTRSESDEYLGRSSQPVDRQQAKRWGTIDKDNVVVLTHGLDGILELPLTVHGRHEFDLRARKVEARWRDEQVLDRDRFDCVFQRNVLQEDVVQRVVELAGFKPSPVLALACGSGR